MKNKGFTLLFASLVVSLVLALGLSIASISVQQFLLASSGRESQVAFYNADTGIECALYYDHGKVPDFQFPSTSGDDPGTIICNGQAADGTDESVGGSPTTTTLYLINPSLTCDQAKSSYAIEVNKAPAQQNETFFTDIKARGYNTCDATNPRRVERGLEVKY